MASRNGRLIAVGPKNSCRTRVGPAPPPIASQSAGLTAAAIGPASHFAVGTEDGHVRTSMNGGPWGRFTFGPPTRVAAIAYAPLDPRLIRVVWKSGEMAELDSSSETWRLLYRFPTGIHAAAWTRSGTMVAVAIGKEVWLVVPGAGDQATVRLLVTHEGGRDVAG